MNGIKLRIINNLKGRVHGVADHIALNDIEDRMAGMEALLDLQKEGIVEAESVNIALPRAPAVMRAWQCIVEAESVNIALPRAPAVMRKLYKLTFEGRQVDLGLKRIK